MNFENPRLRRAMLGEMRWWLDTTGIDGFRREMAGGVPTEFWVDARRELAKSRPDAFMLAESEDQGIHSAFGMTYAWQLHHLLTGQEVSMQKRLRFFEKDTVDWSGPSLADVYRTVFDLKHRQAALGNGAAGGAQTALRTDGGDRVYAFTHTKGPNTVLVVVNFADAPAGAVLDGVNVASLALMAVVTWQLARSTLIDALTVTIAAVSVVLLMRFRTSSAWLVGGGAVIGVAVTWLAPR